MSLVQPQQGWPTSLGHRARQPAAAVDVLVQQTKARKRKLKPKPAWYRPVESTTPQVKPPTQRWRQFYDKVASGEWQQQQQTATRRRLFSSPDPPSATRGLRAKLVPALKTTSQWTRVQRSILPKYLFVLDAVTAVLLLECLCRLQPPLQWRQASPLEQAGTGQAGTNAAGWQQEHQQQDQQQQQQQQQKQQQQQQQQQVVQLAVSFRLLAGLRTSISGPFKSRQAPVLEATDPAAAAAWDARAAAHGFADVASERQEFEAMCAAVFAVLQHKLAAWPGHTLVSVLSCCGRLQVQHEGLLQAWLDASAPHLGGLSMVQLMACLEGLARLSAAPPPEAWCQQWVHATQARLQQLSLPQLAALQVFVAVLQLQPPHAWMQQFKAAVLYHFGEADALQPAPETARAAAAAQGASDVESVQLTMPMADAVSSMLCSSLLLAKRSSINGSSPDDQSSHPPAGHHHAAGWLQLCLQVCTHACKCGRLSTGGALQLLAACWELVPAEEAVAAREAALQLLLQRMSKLPCPEGVELLFACLLAGPRCSHVAGVGGHPQQQQQEWELPAGFRAALEAGLVEVMPVLPDHLVVLVPSVLAACGQQQQQQQEEQLEQQERLQASFALATRARLPQLDAVQLSGLVCGCAQAGFVMPTVWCCGVLDRRRRLGAAGTSTDVDAAMTALQQVAADWQAVINAEC